jgi:hypothetical protein
MKFGWQERDHIPDGGLGIANGIHSGRGRYLVEVKAYPTLACLLASKISCIGATRAHPPQHWFGEVHASQRLATNDAIAGVLSQGSQGSAQLEYVSYWTLRASELEGIAITLFGNESVAVSVQPFGQQLSKIDGAQDGERCGH